MFLLYTFPGSKKCDQIKKQFNEDQIHYREINLFSNCLKDGEVRYLIFRSAKSAAQLIKNPAKIKNLLGKDASQCTESEYVKIIRENPTLLNVPIVLSSQSLSAGCDFDLDQIEIHDEILEDSLCGQDLALDPLVL